MCETVDDGGENSPIAKAPQMVLAAATGKRAALFVSGSIIFLAVGLVSFWAAKDDARGVVSLGALLPVVAELNRAGAWLLGRVPQMVSAFSLLCCIPIFAAALAFLKQRAWPPLLFTITLAFALTGQLCFVLEMGAAALLLFGAASVAALALYRYGTSFPQTPTPFSFSDSIFVVFVTLVAALFRFFALNRIHPFFEGELSPYELGATTFHGIFLANAGVHGPWAPLGLLYYMPIYFAVNCFGATVPAVRIGSASVSTLTVALVYVLMRRITTRSGALIASLLVALESLQIGWGRTDVHPHGSTTWLNLLLCLVTLQYLDTKRAVYLAALVPLMALTWHQYPSGQTGFLIPLFSLSASILAEKKILNFHKKMGAAVAAGVLLWLAGGPAAQFAARAPISFWSYFQNLGPRFYPLGLQNSPPLLSMVLSSLEKAGRNAVDLIEGIFFQAPYLFHQDILLPIPGLPVRTMSALSAALAAVFLGTISVKHWRSPNVSVLLAWLAAALLPALFSDHAYPKRAATLYPALCCMAGVTAAYFSSAIRTRGAPRLRTVFALSLAAGFVGWVCIASYQWFSGNQVPFGIPGEVSFAEMLSKRLTPGTVVILGRGEPSFHGKLSYLLLDRLTHVQPAILYHYRPEDMDWENLVAEPARVVPLLERKVPYHYLWTDLRNTLPMLSKETHWRTLVFIIQKGLKSEEDIREVRAAYPDAEELQFPGQNCSDCHYTVLRVSLP